MGGKAYRQDTRIYKIFKNTIEAKKVYFKNTEVFSSSHDVAYHIDVNNIVVKEIEDETDIIAQAPEATKTGWTLVGWRLDTAPDPDVLVEYIATEDDIHVYAVFEQTIQIDLVGGSTTLHQTGIRYYNNSNYANPTITLQTATLSGWTLVGYRLDMQPDPTVPYYGGQAYTFTQNTTLYTVFKQTVTLSVLIKGTTYTYPRTRYVNNNHYANPSVTVSDPTLSAAVFNGYSSSASSTSIAISTLSTGYTFAQDTNFYAVWTYNNQVLSNTEIYKTINGPGTVNVLGINGHHFKSLSVRVQSYVNVAGWYIQSNALVYIGGTFILYTYKIHEHEYPVEEGPCANGATATVDVTAPDQENWTLQCDFTGDISDQEISWVRTYNITGIGRTVVY